MNEYKNGNIVDGVVTGIEEYGIFVKLNDNYQGLIHISEISEKYVRNIYKYAKVGENIKVKIINIDDKKKQLKLSIKNIDGNKNGMVETGTGFKLLKDNIDKWIDEYKKNKKN